MKTFKSKKTRFIGVEEFNKRLEYCKEFTTIYRTEPHNDDTLGKYKSFFCGHLSRANLTYFSEEGLTTYTIRLDTDDMSQAITGLDAFRIMSKYYKVPRWEKIKFSASALIWKNDKYERERHHVYYYDLNSAYATIMANYKFPDTSVQYEAKVVSEGEIGFTERGEIVHPGEFAMFVFPLMDSPFKKFAEVWFKRRKNPKMKQKAKNVLCYSVGYLQRVNPFLRAYIINSCNDYVKGLISEETTVYCNTDCIVSLVPLDLPIGSELGEWKYKEGEFAYDGLNYQFDKETPVWRGIPKGWWKQHPDFDILTDEPPHSGNIYRVDYEEFRILNEEI